MLSEGREPRCGEEEEGVTVTPVDKGGPRPTPSEVNERGEAGGASITPLGNEAIIIDERETYREGKLMVLRFQSPEVQERWFVPTPRRPRPPSYSLFFPQP